MITIRIKQGQATVGVTGVAGAGCHAKTARLEEKLGRVVADHRTDEFYKDDVQREGEGEHEAQDQ